MVNCCKYWGLMFFVMVVILEIGISVIMGVDWSNNMEFNFLLDKWKMVDCFVDFESV